MENQTPFGEIKPANEKPPMNGCLKFTLWALTIIGGIILIAGLACVAIISSLDLKNMH